MIFGLDGKVRRSVFFPPGSIAPKGVFFVYLPESFLPILRTYLETISFIEMLGRVFFTD